MTRHRLTAARVAAAAGLAAVALTFVALPAGADPSPAPTPAPAPAPAPSPAPTPGQPPHPGPSGPSPAPTKTPATPPATAPGAGVDDPSWMDPEGLIRRAIASFLAWVAKQALNPALDALGRTVLATPNLTGDERVRDIWTGSLVVTNTVFVLVVIIGGFVVMSRDSLHTRAGLKELAPRLAVAALAANLSLVIIGKAIGFTNAVTAGIAHRGVDPQTAAEAIAEVIEAHLIGNDVTASVLIIAMDLMALVVAATYVLRIMLMVGLIGIAPLALACHALPQTEQVAYTWWRSLAACLVIQVGQAVVLVAALRIFLTPTDAVIPGTYTGKSLLGLLVCATTLWLMLKIPSWTRHYVLAGLHTQGRGLIRQVIGAVLLVKTLGRLTGATKLATGSRTPTRPLPMATGSVQRRHATPRRGIKAKRPTKPPTLPAPAGPHGSGGPVAFSQAPATQTPLPRPAGDHTAARFSDTPTEAVPRTTANRSRPSGPAFSHAPVQHTSPAPARPVPPAGFTAPSAPSTPAPRPAPPAGAAQPATFSHAPQKQVAPKRPPAPVTPTFSHAQPAQPRKPRPRPRGRRDGSTERT